MPESLNSDHLREVRGRERLADGRRGGEGVPVVATSNREVRADFSASEAQVVAGQGTSGVDEVGVEAGDIAVIADVAARDAAEVAGEAGEVGNNLVGDDGLGLDLADLFGDDSLGHLNQDSEALLDELDLNVLADQGVLRGDDLLADGAVEVVLTVEVIEARQGGDSVVVIEAGEAGDGRLGGDTGS